MRRPVSIRCDLLPMVFGHLLYYYYQVGRSARLPEQISLAMMSPVVVVVVVVFFCFQKTSLNSDILCKRYYIFVLMSIHGVVVTRYNISLFLRMADCKTNLLFRKLIYRSDQIEEKQQKAQHICVTRLPATKIAINDQTDSPQARWWEN